VREAGLADAVSDVEPERLRELIRLFGTALPDHACLRCGSGSLYVRAYRNPRLFPAFENDEVVETVCTRCGMVETHLVDLLHQAVAKGTLPVVEKNEVDER
jgi:hypothetical protein